MTDKPSTAQQDSVDFGFTTVRRAEKRGLVRSVFDSVAPRYDRMNDLMSLGIHRVWKRIFVSDLDPRPQYELLDLAAGTGDITLGWMSRGGGSALMSDINEAMLGIGRDRALDRGWSDRVVPIVADGEKLPFPDRFVDRVSIAFGLRNCTDKEAVLAEARRVLKPGGRFLCLEFSRVQVAALRPFYDAWSFRVLPPMGKLVAGDADSYRYLAESIRTFPDQDELSAMMRSAGFSRVTVRNLSGGIAAIHAGWRL
ncbi:MAG: class I SAM-dependent methyltransferase [Acetobacteraceae bacterium]